MPTLSQHRFVVFALSLATLIVLLARPLTILLVNFRLHSMGGASSVPAVAPKRSVKLARNIPHLNKKSPVVPALNQFSLSPMTRDFNSQVSGITLCEGVPCSATLKVSLESDKLGQPVIQTIQSERDGSFQLQIHFQALPNSQMDWRITAQSQDLLMGDAHGRQILSDDSPIVVSRTINLH